MRKYSEEALLLFLAANNFYQGPAGNFLETGKPYISQQVVCYQKLNLTLCFLRFYSALSAIDCFSAC